MPSSARKGNTVISTSAYATKTTFAYTPAATGNYALSVKVKDSTATVVKVSAVTKVFAPLTITAVTPSKTGIYVGEPITWTLYTSGGLSTKQYYYTLYNGSVIVNTPAWESFDTFTYTPVTTGSYALSVKVKDNATQASKTSGLVESASMNARNSFSRLTLSAQAALIFSSHAKAF